MTIKRKNTVLLGLLFMSLPAFSQVKGLIQVRAVASDDTQSFQDGGIGLYRHGDSSDSILLSQGIIDFKADLSSAWSAHAVVNANQEPNTTLGLSQAYLQYQPLVNSRYKWHVKLGGFYPSMSLENPDIGWTSPYNYTNSAINSWLGEELRTIGGELSIKRPGKRFNSKHSFSVSAAIYKGNDPTGTLLSWRGFALHDRQTTFNESVQFALIAALNSDELRRQANQVLPFEEVDGRFGYYAGVHWDYLKRSQFRFYYYDNNADPSIFNRTTGQYAWHTRFSSLAWLYKFTGKTRLIAQLLDGKTEMGAGKHRLSLRYDYFKVDDDDTTAFDPNASHGEGLTATWRYQLTDTLQIGVEGSALHSFVQNRPGSGFAQRLSQQQLMANAQWRF